VLFQQLLNGVVLGASYSLFALGFTLIFGVQHVLNLAHGSIFMWGAFVGVYLTRLGLPLPAVLTGAAFASGFISIMIDFVAFRPLRKRNAPEFSAIISSLGANLILINIAARLTESQVIRFPAGTFPVIVFSLAGVRFSLLQLVILLIVAGSFAALLMLLYRTSFGRQLRAVAISSKTAPLLGINMSGVNVLTFFVAGASAGLAGVMLGLSFNSVDSLMGEPLLLKAFVIIVIGGLGSIHGAIAAGFFLGIVQSLTIAYMPSEVSDTIIFSLLFLVLLVRPTGFFGTKSEGSSQVVRI